MKITLHVHRRRKWAEPALRAARPRRLRDRYIHGVARAVLVIGRIELGVDLVESGSRVGPTPIYM